MNCPRCDRQLTPVKVNGVEIDACQGGCGGIWFDAFELEKLDQPDESASWLLENMRVDLAVEFEFDKPIHCPRCENITLMRQRYRHDQHIKIDKCQACGGVWLDFGELFEIRLSNPTTAESRASAADILRGIRRPGLA